MGNRVLAFKVQLDHQPTLRNRRPTWCSSYTSEKEWKKASPAWVARATASAQFPHRLILASRIPILMHPAAQPTYIGLPLSTNTKPCRLAGRRLQKNYAHFELILDGWWCRDPRGRTSFPYPMAGGSPSLPFSYPATKSHADRGEQRTLTDPSSQLTPWLPLDDDGERWAHSCAVLSIANILRQ